MAINDISRNLGPSVSQSHTSEAIGHAEDYSKVITNIAPDLTFYLSRFADEEPATTLKFGWITEGLKPPKVNAHLEKEDYEGEPLGSLEAAENNCQRFVSSGYVTEAQRKVAKIYNPEDEKARLLTNLLTQHARDIEYALVNNATTNAENGSTPALTGGVPYFMQTQTVNATITTAGLVTASEAHNLTDGDFVYFTATTMPTGLSQGTIYYVEKASDTTFYIHNTMKDAVEKVTANRVAPSATGTGLKIVKNNVIDLGGSVDVTLDDIDKAMEMAFNRGGNPTLAVMSPAKKRTFSKLIVAATQIQRSTKADRKLDLVADVLTTDYGVLTAEAHRLYPDNRIDIMDMDYWGIKTFTPTHEVTGIAKRGSYDEFFVETQLGLKGTQPKASAAIVGIKR